MLDLDSLFNLSYGMCVVSSRRGDRFNGCIVNTIFQITPDPPMLAISLNKENLTWEYICESKVFSISILSEDSPRQYTGKFGFRSGRDIDKFEDVNYKTGKNGLPILTDYTVGFIEAEVTDKIDVETHTIFIAKITSCETIDSTKTPMTYSYYRDIRHGRTPKTAATYHEEIKMEKVSKNMKKYKCILCGYIYDPAVGDPDNGIEPRTSFEELPNDWVCPECGAGKDQFEIVG